MLKKRSFGEFDQKVLRDTTLTESPQKRQNTDLAPIKEEKDEIDVEDVWSRAFGTVLQEEPNNNSLDVKMTSEEK